MKYVHIPSADWHIHLSEAIRNADAETVIVVNNETKRELAYLAAARMGKQIAVKLADEE